MRKNHGVNTPGSASTVVANSIWHSRAQRYTPAGVHSNARLVGAETVLVRGEGPWLFDVEGNRFVDYMLGRGPALLGHTPAMINDAVAAAVRSGITLGAATPLEIAATEAVLSVTPWADQLRFATSGTEAVQAAFRLARAATNRPLIVQFEGLYHGWLDDVSLERGTDWASAIPSTEGQKPTSADATLLLPWNDVEAVDEVFRRWGDQIAAVITEPANIFGGRLAAPGYLQHLRDVTTAHGSVLIFDEVVTGFRLQPGSSASLFGVTPDLATFAKAMGSGWPVAAVVGRADLFDGVAVDRVRLSGTYNGNAAAMAAVVASVEALASGSVHAQIARTSASLQQGLIDAARSSDVAVSIEGFPGAFWLVFDEMERAASDARAEQLGLSLRASRVIMYHHTWLLSGAHDDASTAFTVDALSRVLRAQRG
jgi:glutamate-1-semialdehyde 2,1-aminomutase